MDFFFFQSELRLLVQQYLANQEAANRARLALIEELASASSNGSTTDNDASSITSGTDKGPSSTFGDEPIDNTGEAPNNMDAGTSEASASMGNAAGASSFNMSKVPTNDTCKASTNTTGVGSTSINGKVPINNTNEASTDTTGKAWLNNVVEALANNAGKTPSNNTCETSTNVNGEASTGTNGEASNTNTSKIPINSTGKASTDINGKASANANTTSSGTPARVMPLLTRSVNRASQSQGPVIPFLQTPVYYVELPTDFETRLFGDVGRVLGAYRDIRKIAVGKRGFIPGRLRGLLDPTEWAPEAFDNQQQDCSCYFTRSGELDKFQSIVTVSRYCLEKGVATYKWHTLWREVFFLALQDEDLCDVSSDGIPNETMRPACFPPLQGGLDWVIERVDAVDFKFNLTPDYSSSLGRGLRRAVYRYQTAEERYFGTAKDECTRFCVNGVAISIQVKGQNLRDTKERAGLWAAAWYHRLLDMMPHLAQAGLPLPPLPVIIVENGLVWKLYYACYSREKIDIVGGMRIGGTLGEFDLFVLVAVLRRLAKWMQYDLTSWLKDVV